MTLTVLGVPAVLIVVGGAILLSRVPEETR